MTDGRRCERKVVRRLHASFSGSPEVGNGLDGELAQLVPRAGLTSAQTDAVIPPGTTVSSRSRSLKAEFRRRTTFHSCTPPSNDHIRDGRGSGGLPPVAPGGSAKRGGQTAASPPFLTFVQQHKRKIPGTPSESGDLKNGGYLLSQLVGQYHRRW